MVFAIPFILCANEKRSTLSLSEYWKRHSFYIIPTASYSPETDWSFGLAGSHYFKLPNSHHSSSVSYQADYSLLQQFRIHGNTRLNIQENNLIYCNLQIERYPEKYYGRGNQEAQLLNTPIQYIPWRVKLVVQPLWRLAPHWYIGPHLSIWMEKSSLNEETGLKSFFIWGPGFVLNFDNRDNVYYPTHGCFFKSSFYYSGPYLGSSARMLSWQNDLRGFIHLGKGVIIGGQLVTNMVYGTSDIPVQILPSIGGSDLMRGIRYGIWRDNLAISLQSELRFPIWKLLSGATFISAGDVYNLYNWQWSLPKIGYGGGIRIQFNDSKVNLRFDVARENYGNWHNFADINTWRFYFTATEAF